MLRALKARYVFPVAAPPIEDGAVIIDGERIFAVGPAGVVLTPTLEVENLGNAAIVPGFVNAHTHLEFSDLAAPLGEPGMAFPQWIRAVVARRQATAPELGEQRKSEAVAGGLRESLSAGTTLLGEIATPPLHWDHYRDSPLGGVAFLESLGFSDERVAAALTRSIELIGGHRRISAWQRGLSPHAPYSTHWQIVAAAGGPWLSAMHLAESREELQLLQSHSGPFRELLDDLGIWRNDALPSGPGVMWYLQQLARSPHALVVHGNYLGDEEIQYIAQHNESMSVVYCPRTHAYFKHDAYPLAKLLGAGVNVALGTDSRASNPDLSLLAEMRHVARHHDVPLDEVLQMGTLRGARALGFEHQVGSLSPRKRADLAVVALPDRDARDPHELLFDSELPNIATYSSLQARSAIKGSR
jgi:cytosine/adenosine deaminase-related metal-dependent hydrolase